MALKLSGCEIGKRKRSEYGVLVKCEEAITEFDGTLEERESLA